MGKYDPGIQGFLQGRTGQSPLYLHGTPCPSRKIMAFLFPNGVFRPERIQGTKRLSPEDVESMRDILTRNMYQVRQRVSMSPLRCSLPCPALFCFCQFFRSLVLFTVSSQAAGLLGLENRELPVSCQVGTRGLRRNANPVAGSRGQAAPALQPELSEPTDLSVLKGKTDTAILLQCTKNMAPGSCCPSRCPVGSTMIKVNKHHLLGQNHEATMLEARIKRNTGALVL